MDEKRKIKLVAVSDLIDAAQDWKDTEIEKAEAARIRAFDTGSSISYMTMRKHEEKIRILNYALLALADEAQALKEGSE